MPTSKDRHDVRKPSSMRHGFRSSDRKLRPTSTPWWQWRGVGSTTARSKISGVLTSDCADNSSTHKLEVMARGAGLLGQSITHIRVFKRAKKSLGIRSFRAGFGARSEWRWQLPRQSEGSIKTHSGTARERRGTIPIDWVQGVAYLDPDRPPNDVPRHRWRQFVGDCKNFLSSSEHWANRAAGLGWDAMALFGCAPKRPLDYLGSAGLLWGHQRRQARRTASKLGSH